MVDFSAMGILREMPRFFYGSAPLERLVLPCAVPLALGLHDRP